MTFLAFLLSTVLAGAVHAQSEDCSGVDSGLSAILGPCRSSVSLCVTSQNLPQVSSIFCLPNARTQYNNFLECTNTTFTDQIFGAICGGENSSCASFEETADETTSTPFEKCFEGVDRNDGTDVFQYCDCSVLNSPSDPKACPLACRESLEDFVDDVGCCSNTALYVYFFSNCDSSLSLQNIDRLFQACNLTLPSSCLHPFSPECACAATDGGSKLSSEFTMLVFIFLVYHLLN